jgi:HK97 family phage major capsid protein
MSEIAKRLRDRRLNVWNEAKALTDKVTEENREFSAEEQGSWDAYNEELDKLDARIKSVLEQEKRAKDADDTFNALAGKPVERHQQTEGNSELRAFFRGDPGAPRFYDVNPTGIVNFRQIREEQRVGLTKLTAAAGLNTVPTSFYDRLVAHLIEVSGMLKADPTVLNTTSGEVIQVPKTTAHSTGALVAEQAALSQSEPTFGQISLGAFKYGVLIQASRELLSDTGVDLEGYLAMQAGRAIGNALGANLITGTGTTMPRGIVVDATSGATGETVAQQGAGGVVGGTSYGPLIDLQYSVIAPYRDSTSCRWMMKDSTVGNVRKVRDSTGQPIWQPSMQLGAPDILLGKPVVTDPNVAAIGSASKSVLFGDFSQYFVRLAGGVRFERSDDFAFSTDMVTFRCILRGDGALVDLTGAVKFLTGGTA